jgi:hypothetical protein
MRRHLLHVILAAGFAWLGLVLIADAPATLDGSHRGMSRRAGVQRRSNCRY